MNEYRDAIITFEVRPSSAANIRGHSPGPWPGTYEQLEQLTERSINVLRELLEDLRVREQDCLVLPSFGVWRGVTSPNINLALYAPRDIARAEAIAAAIGSVFYQDAVLVTVRDGKGNVPAFGIERRDGRAWRHDEPLPVSDATLCPFTGDLLVYDIAGNGAHPLLDREDEWPEAQGYHGQNVKAFLVENDWTKDRYGQAYENLVEADALANGLPQTLTAPAGSLFTYLLLLWWDNIAQVQQ